MIPTRSVPRSTPLSAAATSRVCSTDAEGLTYGRQKCLAGVGEGDAVGGAVEQPYPELALERLDGDRERGLHIAQTPRGAGEALLLGDRDEMLELPNLHVQRDGISNLMVTVVYAAYAVGVIGSLFLGGHLSDWVGRRRVFVPALLANAVSAAVFIVDPSLAGLIVARIISGISVGLTTATATSYLAELHAAARPSASERRAEVVATASNLGGIGFGPLAAGLLAQFAPAPLRLPYLVFGSALVVLAAAVALSPETLRRPVPRARYRPQRIVVPERERSIFYAATLAGMAAFAVFGVFTRPAHPRLWCSGAASPRSCSAWS